MQSAACEGGFELKFCGRNVRRCSMLLPVRHGIVDRTRGSYDSVPVPIGASFEAWAVRRHLKHEMRNLKYILSHLVLND